MKNLQERFDEKWIPEAFSGCWLWIGAIAGETGYGVFWLDEGKLEGAHRVAWKLYSGRIPEGKEVLHRCDTRSCVNPAHLFIGNQTDNNLDAMSKGRFDFPLGERNGKAKLTKAQAIEILDSGETNKTLAKRFGVNRQTIADVRSGRTWSHVKGCL